MSCTCAPAAPQLFCKGADNIIKSLLSSTLNTPKSLAQIDEHVMGYVNDGLRTLLLAKAELKESAYKAWAKKYQEAETSIKNRDEKRSVGGSVVGCCLIGRRDVTTCVTHNRNPNTAGR